MITRIPTEIWSEIHRFGMLSHFSMPGACSLITSSSIPSLGSTSAPSGVGTLLFMGSAVSPPMLALCNVVVVFLLVALSVALPSIRSTMQGLYSHSSSSFCLLLPLLYLDVVFLSSSSSSSTSMCYARPKGGAPGRAPSIASPIWSVGEIGMTFEGLLFAPSSSSPAPPPLAFRTTQRSVCTWSDFPFVGSENRTLNLGEPR